jgi:hypothetical protein
MEWLFELIAIKFDGGTISGDPLYTDLLKWMALGFGGYSTAGDREQDRCKS